jgi:hypothetical protein
MDQKAGTTSEEWDTDDPLPNSKPFTMSTHHKRVIVVPHYMRIVPTPTSSSSSSSSVLVENKRSNEPTKIKPAGNKYFEGNSYDSVVSDQR